MADVPNRLDVVQRVAKQFAHLLKINTYKSAAEFTMRVLAELERTDPDEEFGATKKVSPENGYTFPDGIRRSHDVITHKPTGTQIDLLTAGGARDDPGPEGPRDAEVKWSEINRPYRPSNVWIEPFRFADDGRPVEPPDQTIVTYPGDAYWDRVTQLLEQDMRAVGQVLNFQSGRWIARTIWDSVVGDERGVILSLDESVRKHRNEWRAVLGLPPL